MKSSLCGQNVYFKKVLLEEFRRNSILQEATSFCYPVITLKINYFTCRSDFFSILNDCISKCSKQ